MPRSGPPPWLSYVGAAIAVAGLLWGAASQWFDVQTRLKLIEARESYEHGNYAVPK